jgi:hypothetical protein
MKALSVKQPWASLICSGIKDVENRSWHTLYRGPLFIHASLSYDKEIQLSNLVGMRLPLELLNPITFGDLPCGVVLGKVELADIVIDYQSPWADPDCYHWVLKNAVLFEKPLPAKGKLGLWEFDIERGL